MKRRYVLALLWAAVVALLLAWCGHLWLERRITPDTDILALLPRAERDPVLQLAFTRMVDAAQQKMIVLVGAKDWEQAQRAADAYRAVLLPRNDLIEFIGDAGGGKQDDWIALFKQHGMLLMTDEDEQALRNHSSQQWIDAARAKLYSPFAGPKAVPWQNDPFGLFGGWLQTRAQETPVRPRDGRLFVADGNRQFVVMPLVLRVPAFSMDAQKTVVPLLADARRAASAAAPDAEVLAAGMVLHASAASKQAEREVSTIGLGSLAGIVLLMWLSFRSLKPIAYIFILIAVGCVGALSVCLLVFERVHLLTLVFGATLIGVAQDYGIYFLCNRLDNDGAVDSVELMRRLFPSLLLTLVAAAIGYTGLALTPFPGLRQMAVFSVTGLVFAWLTVVFWYPVLLQSTKLRYSRLAQSYGALPDRWPVLRANRRSILAALAVGIVIVIGWVRIGVNDDIRSLQNPPKELVDEQIRIGKLLDTPTPVQFYLVRGASAEQVLQREEVLRKKLEPFVARHAITGYHSISNWVPSARTQAERRKLIEERLLADNTALPALAKEIGQDEEWVHAQRKRLEATPALTVDEFMKSPAAEPWRHLWLAHEEGYAGIVALRGLTLAELPALRQVSSEIEGVQWVDKVEDISSVLGRYREYMGWALMLSYVAVFWLLTVRYRASAWRVLAPTAVASAATIALLSLLGQPLQLFHVLALMLLLGVGVDYGVFYRERQEGRASAWLAVGLSAANTLLSFGLLALSRTPALQAFGSTMLLGTTLVWFIVPCFGRGETVIPADAAALKEVCP